MNADPPLVAVAVAAALHAGFQVTVSLLVYPVLLGSGEDWRRRHDAHSRAIVPLVAVTYGALLGACVWAVVAGVGRGSPGLWVAVGGAALTLAGAPPRGAPPPPRRGGGGRPPPPPACSPAPTGWRHDSPVTAPSSSTSMRSAFGEVGRPGIVRMSPQIA